MAIYFQTIYRRQPVRAKRVLVASQTFVPRLTARLIIRQPERLEGTKTIR
jgi:hypothetical protein